MGVDLSGNGRADSWEIVNLSPTLLASNATLQAETFGDQWGLISGKFAKLEDCCGGPGKTRLH
jgi:hypothetical protein